MAVFSVITHSPENYEPLKSYVMALFPTDSYEVGDGHYLVSFGGTAKELFAALFPEPEGSPGYFRLPSKNIIVFGVLGYWGLAQTDMWEWIASRLASKSA